MSLADRIQEVLDASKLSVAELAKEAGVTPSAVYQWLGKSSKEIKTIQLRPALLIERKTGFSALWISAGEGPKRIEARIAVPPPPPADFADSQKPSESEWDMLRDMRVLPQQEREALARELHNKADLFRAYTTEVLRKAKGEA